MVLVQYLYWLVSTLLVMWWILCWLPWLIKAFAGTSVMLAQPGSPGIFEKIPTPIPIRDYKTWPPDWQACVSYQVTKHNKCSFQGKWARKKQEVRKSIMELSDYQNNFSLSTFFWSSKCLAACDVSEGHPSNSWTSFLLSYTYIVYICNFVFSINCMVDLEMYSVQGGSYTFFWEISGSHCDIDHWVPISL